MSGPSELSRLRRARLVALVAGVSVILLGGVALAGWLFHVEALKSIIPGGALIKPNMAAGFSLCGVILTLLSLRTPAPSIRSCARGIAAIVIVLVALTLGEHFFGWNFPIEQWFIGNLPDPSGASHPGRMAPVSALGFLLGGSALFAEAFFARKQSPVPLVVGLSAALVFMGAMPLAAFLMEVLFGPQWNFMGMTISGVIGATGFMLLGTGLLALLQSEGDLTWSLNASTTTGFVLGLLLITVAAAAGFNFTRHMVETSKWVAHRQDVLKKTEEVLSGLATLGSNERVYVMVGDELLLKDRQTMKAAIADDFRELRGLAQDNTNQQRRLDRLESLITQRMAWEERVIIARREEGFAAAAGLIATGPGLQLSDEILRKIKEMEAGEYRLLDDDLKQADTAVSTAFALLPLGVFLSLAVLSLSVFFLNAGMTERAMAEKDLRQSEERMRAILESALDCVITMDHEGKVLEFNPAAEKTFGYRRDEAIGQLLSELIIPPALRERHQKGLSHYLASGEAPVLGKRLELSAVRRDGSEFPVELAITRIGSQSPPMFTGFIRDITARKELDLQMERLRTEHESVLNSLGEGVHWIDVDGRIKFENPAAAKMLGYEVSELIGKPAHPTMHHTRMDGAPYPQCECCIYATLRDGVVRRVTDEVFWRKDGSSFPVEYICTPVYDKGGHSEGSVVIFTDITERKRAGKALEQAEEKYRGIVENALEGIFQTTSEGGYVSVNPALARIYGYGSPEELMTTVTDIGHVVYVNPERRTEFKHLIEAQGSVERFEYEVYRKDGKKVWLSENARAVRDASGAVIYYEGTAEDITKRKRAEDALHASEERYRSLFESNPNPMWVYDIETLSFLAVNATAIEHYGYSQDEFLAMTIKDIRPAEDIPALMDDLAKKTGDVKNSTPWRHCRKDKTMIYVELASRDLFWLGRRARLVLINDITERKRAEQKLLEQADFLNLAQDAIMVRGMDDRIEFWNRGAEHLYGWSAEEVCDQPSCDFLDYEEPLKILAERILLETGAWSGECRHLTKQGNSVIVQSRWTLVRDEHGEPKAKLIMMTDVTEQKKLETHLLRAQRLESIGTLASGVAHDLNNILTPILMCAEVLRHGPAAEDAALSIALIEESAKRGANVVKQVLTFARGIEGERVAIKPSHLIQEMIDIAQKTFPKTIEIIGRYTDDLWSIKCDPTQLHQVLLNLSVNARDAMPHGGSLTLAAENFTVDENYAAMTPDAKAGPYVMFRVSDSGAGMPRATVDKIFDPFFTTKGIGKGTGLGLSTVRGIVKSHGGFISVYSEIGKGTTFKIFLPATMSDVELQKSKTLVAPIQGNGEQILVVDDEPNILRITKMIFEKHNYRVVSASDGPEALALFAQQMDSIGGVLTDISMPYMDGVALVRALRRMKADIPIIASTGQGDQPGMIELQSLGVKNFLTKPYNTEKLLATVHDTLQGRGSVG